MGRHATHSCEDRNRTGHFRHDQIEHLSAFIKTQGIALTGCSHGNDPVHPSRKHCPHCHAQSVGVHLSLCIKRGHEWDINPERCEWH